ncbi:MAG TPA: dihydrodipicolinate synthase family protein [bacterium]|jgi:D-arabinose 5-phosphate isomerase GutQ/dihydrodipicolinate synthase/N-acetylneuraminate lyase|nr:dihydrodipicolinate synthase family protein [bacterium]
MDYVLPGAPLIHGLCVPMVTALDAQGRFDAASQERLVAFLARGENGSGGAQALFTNGTSGEWHHFEPGIRLAVTETAHYALSGGRGPRLWAGINDRAAEGVVANLEHAVKLGASAAVVAPLAVENIPDAGSLFHRHISPLYQRLGKGLPLFLYDNPDVYRMGRQDRLRTGEVKQLARLDYVCGVKVTADVRTAGNYLKGARNFKARHEFGVYLGRALQAFPFFTPVHGPLGKLRERWRRFWVAPEAPHGIVPLSANLFPGAWRRAWSACVAGDVRAMDAYRDSLGRLHEAFRFGDKHKGIACVKIALAWEGVLGSARTAPETPALSADEEARWSRDYREIKKELARADPSPTVTVLASSAPASQVQAAGSGLDLSAREHLRVALSELGSLAEAYPVEPLEQAGRMILEAEAKGRRVHVTGVGKCEYVAGFIASSYSSTGTPAFFLHATEAGHGASGQVAAGDVVVAISNSGETGELKAAVDTLQRNGARILGVGGRPDSWLARRSEVFLRAGVRREGDELDLAPRNSVLAEILVLNALGVALQHHKRFTADQFRAYHPGGSLGRTQDGEGPAS